MKKIIIAALCLASFSAVNAQYFVGGGFNLATTGGSYKSSGGDKTDKASTSSFTLTPRVGYFLSDKVAVGLGLSYSLYKQTIPYYNGGNDDRKTTTSLFSIAPFARYYFFKVNRFSFYGEGVLNLGFGSSVIKDGSNTTSDNSISAFSLDITPAVSYSLTEKFELEAAINLFRFGYSSYTEKDEDDNKNTTTGFNFGAGTDDIVTLGSITVSAIYRF